MSLILNNDIGDDEIRIISPREKKESQACTKPKQSETTRRKPVGAPPPVAHAEAPKAAMNRPRSFQLSKEIPDKYTFSKTDDNYDEALAEEKAQAYFESVPSSPRKIPRLALLMGAGVLAALLVVVFISLSVFKAPGDQASSNPIVMSPPSPDRQEAIKDYDRLYPEVKAMRIKGRATEAEKALVTRGYADRREVTADGLNFTVFTPRATDKVYLHVGPDAVDDENAALVVQAADVRGDNGGIVGAFVKNGELISRGESKAGFCAIINGQPVIGVADATSYLEQAIETGGDFFRQFPLVVGGQVVENNRPGESLRKALVQLDGQLAVVMSKEKLTFNQFSKALVDLGVSNAIYLVGSTSYGTFRSRDGLRGDFGERVDDPYPNASYIIWK